MYQPRVPATCTGCMYQLHGNRVESKSKHLKEEIPPNQESQSVKPVLSLELQFPSRYSELRKPWAPPRGQSTSQRLYDAVPVLQRRFWMQSLYSLWHTRLTPFTTSCQVLQPVTLLHVWVPWSQQDCLYVSSSIKMTSVPWRALLLVLSSNALVSSPILPPHLYYGQQLITS